MSEFSELDFINNMYEENIDEDRHFDEALVNKRRHKVIKTRMGSVIEVVGGNIEAAHVDWKYDDGRLHRGYFADLVATDGILDIIDAIKKCGNKYYLEKEK